MEIRSWLEIFCEEGSGFELLDCRSLSRLGAVCRLTRSEIGKESNVYLFKELYERCLGSDYGNLFNIKKEQMNINDARRIICGGFHGVHKGNIDKVFKVDNDMVWYDLEFIGRSGNAELFVKSLYKV